jgi:hypothetical protein
MFTSLVISHLLYAYIVRLPRDTNHYNPRLAAAIGLGVLLQIGAVLGPFRDVFGVVTIDGASWLVAAVAGIVPVGLLAATVMIRLKSPRSAPDPTARPR